MVRHIEGLLNFTSATFYGKEVPRKHWLSGVSYLTILVLLSFFNAYSTSLALEFKIDSNAVLVLITKVLFVILSFCIIIIIYISALKNLSEKISVKSFPEIILIYLLIIYSSYNWFKNSVDNTVIDKHYHEFINIRKENNITHNISYDQFKNGFIREGKHIIYNRNYYVLMLLQGLIFSLLVSNRRSINITLQKEKELMASEQLVENIIIEREKDQIKSNEIISAVEQKSIEEQLKIFSSIQHELGNKIPALKLELLELIDFFKSNELNEILINAPIRKPLQGEQVENITTLNELLQSMDKKVNYSIETIDSLGAIIKASPNSFQSELVNIYDFLTDEIAKYRNEKKNVEVILEGDKIIMTELDCRQFSFAIQNFISNAFRHGSFDNEAKNYFIKFRFYINEKTIILDIINNGNPLPADYTIDKFTELYNYYGKNGNSGIGGYLIGLVVKNHKGIIEIADATNENAEYKVCFKIKLPFKN